ncbi:MAG: biosynthetic-type acetolactate synthase large subunit [Candidatus Roizmanbacteria bacterium]
MKPHISRSAARILSGSQILLETLISLDVDTIFGYPGGAIMPIYDALYDYSDRIRHILVRHEQGASHAAEGWARVRNKPGVCFATSGPGATNLVTGIADAMMDSIPLICITGQVSSHLLGSDAFQEVDVIGITTPITKWNCQVTRASDIAEAVAKAYHIAGTGRPGPVLIDITKDAQFEKVEYKPITKIHLPGYQPVLTANTRQIEIAAKLINEARRPLILAGHGVLISHASSELIRMSEIGSIPVAVTLHGLSSMPATHPNYVGWLGMHGNYAPNMLTNKADVICAIGMRFDDRVTGRLKDYAPHAKIIHIDIDPAELHKNVKTTVPIVADAKNALTALIPLINKVERIGWLGEFHAHYKIEYDTVIKNEIKPTSGKIKMAELMHALSSITDGDAVIVPDVGQHQMKTCRYYAFNQPDSLITSGGMGTMGFALPAAMGAQVASDRQVIAIIGDGCFQMTIQELGTIDQEKIPVKIMILNNNHLGMVRQWQELFFDKRYSFTHLHNPDFVTICKGYGIQAKRVEKRSDLKKSIQNMLSHKGPYVLEVVCEHFENVFPMIPTGASVDEVRLK